MNNFALGITLNYVHLLALTLTVTALPISAQQAPAMAGHLTFKGIGKHSSEAEFRKVFPRHSCKPVGGLEMIDITCTGGPVQIGKITADVTTAIWKEGPKFQLYHVELFIPGSDEKEMLSALSKQFGAPDVKPFASKNVMGVTFIEPSEYTWKIGAASIRLTESASSGKSSVLYRWDFTPEERAYRRARIDSQHKTR